MGNVMLSSTLHDGQTTCVGLAVDLDPYSKRLKYLKSSVSAITLDAAGLLFGADIACIIASSSSNINVS